MAANSLLAGAVQILCVIAYKGEEGANAEMIARSLKTNPVMVRRILKSLENQGLVEVRQGRYGGVGLKRKAADITLEDIYKAVEGADDLFTLRRNRQSALSGKQFDEKPADAGLRRHERSRGRKRSNTRR